jgi:hypothetical protein
VPTIRENARATAATQGILAVRRKIDMHEKILREDPPVGAQRRAANGTPFST